VKFSLTCRLRIKNRKHPIVTEQSSNFSVAFHILNFFSKLILNMSYFLLSSNTLKTGIRSFIYIFSWIVWRPLFVEAVGNCHVASLTFRPRTFRPLKSCGRRRKRTNREDGVVFSVRPSVQWRSNRLCSARGPPQHSGSPNRLGRNLLRLWKYKLWNC